MDRVLRTKRSLGIRGVARKDRRCRSVRGKGKEMDRKGLGGNEGEAFPCQGGGSAFLKYKSERAEFKNQRFNVKLEFISRVGIG